MDPFEQIRTPSLLDVQYLLSYFVRNFADLQFFVYGDGIINTFVVNLLHSAYNYSRSSAKALQNFSIFMPFNNLSNQNFPL